MKNPKQVYQIVQKFVSEYRLNKELRIQNYIFDDGNALIHIDFTEPLNSQLGFLIVVDAFLNEFKIKIKRLPIGDMSEPMYKGEIQDTVFKEKIAKLSVKDLEAALIRKIQ